MKMATHGYRADIIGLAWMATGFFLALALGSYHPSDPSLNSIGATLAVQNKCGYLGSFLSDLLYQFFGWGAWLFVIFAFKNSMQAFRRTYDSLFIGQSTLMLVVSMATVSSLFELHQPIHLSPFPGRISPGGFLGRIVVQTLTPYLNFMGLFLVLWFSFLILLIVYTRSSVSRVLVTGTQGAGTSVLYLWQGWRAVWMWAFAVYDRICFPRFRTSIPLLSWWRRKNERESSKNSAPLNEPTFSHSFLESESSLDSEEEKPVISWTRPSPDLLISPSTHLKVNKKEIEMDAEKLMNKLEQFSISGEITAIRSGPMITLFEFKPEDHVKVARIAHMEDDLMLALKSQSIRIIAPIPGKDVVGIETAHAHRQTVYLKHLIDEPAFWQQTKTLPLVLGRHVDGQPGIMDLRQIPHLMVAGSTGSGKSVFIISFILSLLFRHAPDTLRLMLVDPKQVDLSVFESLPHLLAPPLRSAGSALSALHWCLMEMEKRYRSLAEFQVRDLEDFNKRTKQLRAVEKQRRQEEMELEGEGKDYYCSPQPYICVVLEEFGDLMSSPERNKIESSVVRLAQMARACGIHLILSMQSPRKDVVTGLIKTNIPGRISFKVSSRVDSRIILDEGGGERLLARGDMLYLGPGQARAERYHGPFVKEKEVSAVVNFWRRQVPHLDYPLCFDQKKGGTYQPSSAVGKEDETYAEICAYLSEIKEVSASHLQRKYGLGYPRAARFIDRLEEEGLVGPARGSKPREVLAGK